jgi:hypothetical protein
MPTPSEAGRAVLGILGIGIPQDQIARSTGEPLEPPPEGQAAPGPGHVSCGCPPNPLAAVDPELLEELLEHELDRHLFEED